jgi:hypothetical protein
MPIGVTRWERRDGADRNRFALAALDYCRAWRATAGIRSSRFYWADVDTLVVLTDGHSFDILDLPQTPELAKALFSLSAVGRPAGSERWTEAAAGEATFRLSLE